MSPRGQSPRSTSSATIGTTTGIQIVGQLVAEFFTCHGFCFMPTHYHLIAWFETDTLYQRSDV